MIYLFLFLSILPGLLMLIIPWLVHTHNRKKYLVPVRANIIAWDEFTWFDSDCRAHPGVQLIYRYEVNGVSQTWRGLPVYRVKGVPKSGFATLYLNPDDETDIWEDRRRFDLLISTIVGIGFMTGGVAAVLVYFGMMG